MLVVPFKPPIPLHLFAMFQMMVNLADHPDAENLNETEHNPEPRDPLRTLDINFPQVVKDTQVEGEHNLSLQSHELDQKHVDSKI